MNLREDTRIAEQARRAVAKEKYAEHAQRLAKTQGQIEERVEKVTQRIRDLPEGEELFAMEIKLLEAVAQVMTEATEILGRPETGSPAIGAETEAIELLLQSRRFNPGGGGGGANPGGGGGGTTNDSALSLIGKGANEKELRESTGTSHATGDSGNVLPEEFRTGLDAYFNKLEKNSKDR